MQKSDVVRFSHVCSLLKNIRWGFYNQDDEFKDEEKKIRFMIDLSLDQILFCNQHLTNTLTVLVRADMGHDPFYKLYPKGIFPYYLRNEGQNLVKEYGDEIIQNIENLSKLKIQVNKNPPTPIQFYEQVYSHEDLLDLSKPYRDIILLQRKIGKEFIPYDDLEYGYFIGSLLKKVIDRYRAKSMRWFKILKKYNGHTGYWIHPPRMLIDRALAFKAQADAQKEKKIPVFEGKKPDEM